MTTASVPSLPHSTDGQCSPSVSFGSPVSEPIVEPSASTAVETGDLGAHRAEAHDREPPALVATAPPMVAESRLAKSTGVSSPAGAGVSRQRVSVTPAPAVTCRAPRVDRAELVEPRGREHHHRRASRHAAADEPRVAALRHDRRAGLGTPGDHGGDLTSRPAGRPAHVAGEATGPVRAVGRHHVGVGEHVLGAEDAGQLPASGAHGDRPQQQRLEGPADGTLVVEEQGVGEPDPDGCHWLTPPDSRATRRPGRGGGRSSGRC